MIWRQGVNPRVWEAPGVVAFAEDNQMEEGGYIAAVYKNAARDRPIYSTIQWGGTIQAALKRAVRSFDLLASIPQTRA